MFLFPYFVCSPSRWLQESLSTLCSLSPSLSPCPPSTTSRQCLIAGSGRRPSALLTSRTSFCPRDTPHILVHTLILKGSVPFPCFYSYPLLLSEISFIDIAPIRNKSYLMTCFIRASVDHTFFIYRDPAFLMSKQFATVERKKWHSSGRNLVGHYCCNQGLLFLRRCLFTLNQKRCDGAHRDIDTRVFFSQPVSPGVHLFIQTCIHNCEWSYGCSYNVLCLR